MGKIKLEVESTKSKTGLHAMRRMVVIIRKDKEEIIKDPIEEGKGTYKEGKSGYVNLNLNPNEYAVHVILVRNPKNKVKGRFIVYDHEGKALLEVKYEKLKIRRSWGDKNLSWIIDRVIELIGLSNYVRHKNYATGQSGKSS
ncbi:hypothetical protein Calag_0575 [Caldisphaera lagunensis DSM 15908]|uniref:Uncharacterized protein n=1 Tax=Caldisphaera lagunensis (strain DSM 15908 / JCM 11604 / ANMR 0165 / IC-154) TaxID=1056495 RepID=L0A8X2_CALLD|nr:hypothetical protein [Caldisphaera lagunensis]AFZ70333.1 hypothetical protein Calag_0575 [Caldisphaera lagunensis DSM 15908]